MVIDDLLICHSSKPDTMIDDHCGEDTFNYYDFEGKDAFNQGDFEETFENTGEKSTTNGDLLIC